jgi:excisionase family DNA binding protein
MTVSTRTTTHEQPPRLLDVDGAADYLGVTDRTIRRFVQQRRLPFHKVGKYVRSDPVDLDRYLAEHRVECTPWG